MREGTKGAAPGWIGWLLATVALGFLGAAILFAIGDREGTVERSTPSGGGTLGASAQDVHALTTEIAALRAELAQLRGSLAVASPAASPAPLAPAPTDSQSLQPLIAALDRVAEQLGARVPAIDAPDRQLERREELRTLLWPNEELTDEQAAAWEAEYERQKDVYVFWTEQRVLDTFGRPDSAHTRDDGSWTWEYVLSEDDQVTFHFAGGRVIDVWN